MVGQDPKHLNKLFQEVLKLHVEKEKKVTGDFCPVDKRHKLHYYAHEKKEVGDDAKYAELSE
jgi:hypothetical protein